MAEIEPTVQASAGRGLLYELGYFPTAEAMGPGEGVEIKYHMQKGAGMVYSWKADG